MCGEKSELNFFVFASLGSPPRVWGKEKDEFKDFIGVGITPTCVGKRDIETDIEHTRTDHPHVCGEKAFIIRCAYFFIGSPPRVWGKVLQDPQFWYDPGITPTCVGKRLQWIVNAATGGDHPHVCGEKLVT